MPCKFPDRCNATYVLHLEGHDFLYSGSTNCVSRRWYKVRTNCAKLTMYCAKIAFHPYIVNFICCFLSNMRWWKSPPHVTWPCCTRQRLNRWCVLRRPQAWKPPGCSRNISTLPPMIAFGQRMGKMSQVWLLRHLAPRLEGCVVISKRSWKVLILIWQDDTQSQSPIFMKCVPM